MKNAKKHVRWWPAAAVVCLGVLVLATCWIWLGWERSGQDKVMLTAATFLVGILLLIFWLLLFSRLPWKTRGAVFGVFLATVVAVSLLFRIRGVSGDLVPILEWRWTQPEVRGIVPDAKPSPAAAEPNRRELPASGEASPSEPARENAASASAKVPVDHPPVRQATSPIPAVARDYPQFLGPNRNATLQGLRLARDWQTHPPRLVWRHPVGAGWSAFAVSGDCAVTQEQLGNDELVVAYDLKTGRARWSRASPARYETVLAGVGPRATPTLSGGRVYALGATGILNCLDLSTGERIWQRDITMENEAPNPEWGRSSSPLVLGDLVVVSAGGDQGKSLVAYRNTDGAPVWRGGNDGAAYSSPFLATLDGVPQIVIFNRASVAAHDPDTGHLLWDYPWPPRQPNVAQPLPVGGDRLLISAGYGVGSKLLKVQVGSSGWLPELVWESPRLKAKFTNLVVHGGFVYGLDDGILVCLDPDTGERRWKGGRYGHGQVILVEDLLLVQTEQGEIVLVEPSPEELQELARFTVLDGKTWNSPALATPFLLVRNDREAACYEMPLAR